MPVPNTFANATTSIPLVQLDQNFATAITLGNTSIQLGNTVTTLNNMTLANVTVSSGNVTVTNATVSGVGTFAAGSNTAPSITFSGDTNTGIYSPAADTIAFTEGGVEAMRLDASGNVGIGTASPAAKLDVNGVIRDSKGDVRTIVQNAQTAAYTLVVGDAGKHISITTGGVTVPASVFSAGDAISIYNNSGSSQTITQGGSVTLRFAGTATTGNRTLAQYGVCTVLCVASNTFVISGAGLT